MIPGTKYDIFFFEEFSKKLKKNEDLENFVSKFKSITDKSKFQ